jgi:hypothetical protein
VDTGQDRPVSCRQKRLIDSLLVEGSIRAASESAAVPYTSARRWMKQPAFRRELQAALAEGRAAGFRILSSSILVASKEMRAALADPDPRIRLAAASAVFKHAEAIALSEIEEKITRLEGSANGQAPARPWQDRG